MSEDDALDHVVGYCICNDVSERAYQLERGGQWMKGKCFPGGFGDVLLVDWTRPIRCATSPVWARSA